MTIILRMPIEPITQSSRVANTRGIHRAGHAVLRMALAAALAAALATALVGPIAQADAIYRVENPDGTVTYTDRPRAGDKTTRLEIDTGNDYHSERAPYDGKPGDAAPVAPVGYNSITVVSPGSEANFHSNEGNVPLTFTIEPALRAGDSVRVQVDGKPMEIGIGADGLGQLTGLERGAHTLVVEVLGANRRTLKTSAPVTFHVHKTSVLLGPNARPNGPARRPAGAVLTPPKPAKPPKP